MWAWIGGILLLVLLGAGILPADSADADVMASFLKGLKNGDVLGWSGNNPCAWTKHIRCQGDSVIGISLESVGLVGTVTADLNKLSSLQYLGLQFNSFYGPLPSLAGLKGLVRAYLNSNQFSSIPPDFFTGLDSLETLYLDYNSLNAPDGWTLPAEVQQLGKLVNLSLTNTSLAGPIPSFLGTMPSLKVLNLAYNKLTGGIPASFINSALVQLELNNMDAPSLSGPIDVVGTMTSLSQLWLQGNRFTGPIPAGLSNAVALRNLKLNDNSLVGPIPANFSKLPLQVFSVDNNQLMGPIPVMPKGTQFTHAGTNQFCQAQPGLSCSPEVSALTDFIVAAGYPSAVVSSWTGNDPCGTPPWTGITCTGTQVTRLMLRASNLVGTISPSIGELKGLQFLTLSNNNLTGPLPPVLGTMASLDTVDVSNNNLTGPMISFSHKVSFIDVGNPLLNAGSPSQPTRSPSPAPPTSPVNQPPPQQTAPAVPGSPPSVVSPPSTTPETPSSRQPAVLSPPASPSKSSSSKLRVVVIAVPVAAGLSLGVLAGVLVLLCCRQKGKQATGSHPRSPLINTMLVHPRSSTSDPDMVKVDVSRNDGRNGASGNSNSCRGSDVVVEAGGLVISIQVLRHATGNFSEATILGRGGFGVVYKGVLDDGTTIAVKRMESSVVSSKGISEFQAEIAVLTKVRHRHLVGLLGYCIDGNEKLLVYEYLPNGTLSQHLFEHQSLGWKPLDWKERLVIALDVAKGMEYLHTLAHMSFIHRDLKPSNILLDEDYRAKVSDFGLVKLAPEGKYSVETRLAGTFGYLAPEYAVTGRVTTKADVFSFGVVLMELITGRKALDDTQSEENMHLVTWFRRTNQSKESLAQNFDPALEGIEEKIDSLWTVAELARHCTAREPYQRPDMGHAVNVLAPLVKQWKPTDMDGEETRGIDLNMTLPQALKQWQASELSDLDDSRNSLPTRPVGFADSFGSADAR